MNKTFGLNKITYFSSKNTPIVLSVSNDNLEAIKATHLVYKVSKDNKTVGYFKTCEMRGNKNDLSDANRKIAYEALANIFGLSEYIPHTDYCILKTDDKEWHGSFQLPSDGSEIWCISSEKRTDMILPKFQMILSKMRLFDSICHELDHSLNNYRPIINQDKKFISVSMFDNGGYGTFGRTAKINCKTYCGLDPLFNDNNSFSFPYQDSELIEKVCNISFFKLYSAINKYLSIDSIVFTYFRILKIRNAIKNDIHSGFLKVLNENQWSQKTVEDELSGKYGNTYLYSLVHDWGGDGVPADKMYKSNIL